ncbi:MULTISPECIES: hypothetical protein [Flavobacterium]|uniref:Uncharacterized protein n=1 Tax=Flavobacterium keumense TaxID=1306518 RepID=A0ABY8N7Z7_9FLAO|nr:MULTISPECIES: hypothetical protein [Flavobacterium]WGK94721.1 hypothetical protein MG292_00395 [Flavobacterium keumense]WGK94734.1 hypothetical protein MG292_00475 [Flavobacterium keumense]
MDQQNFQSSELEFLLDYDAIIAIAPNLQTVLSKETAFEFSKQLYQLTKLVYEKYKDEKEEFNT